MMSEKINMSTSVEVSKNLDELWDELFKVQPKQENTEQIKTLSFQIMQNYCKLKKDERLNEANIKAVCGAALKLSGLIQRGLSGKVLRFLNKYEKKLPDRAVQVLRANLRRMEGF
jgi:hypothetical protein